MKVKQILTSVLIVSTISGLMVGCSTTNTAKQDAQAKVWEQQYGLVAQHGQIQEIQDNDGVLLIKVHNNYNPGEASEVAKMAFDNVYNFTKQTDLSKYKELQYWETMLDDNDQPVKVISFTIQSKGLDMMKDLKLKWSDVNAMSSKVLDFYIYQGLKDANKVQSMFTSKVASPQENTVTDENTEPQPQTNTNNTDTPSKKHTTPKQTQDQPDDKPVEGGWDSTGHDQYGNYNKDEDYTDEEYDNYNNSNYGGTYEEYQNENSNK